ncbi:MAG: hypothetical protein AB7F43_11145 [Bacteriovoracia bacterium]
MFKNDDYGFKEVDVDYLYEGMLMERSIFINLPANNRYVCLVRPLRLLDSKMFRKLLHHGKAYSNSPALEVTYPKLAETVSLIRKICENKILAPFERNDSVKKESQWLANLLFSGDIFPTIFFIHRLVEVPTLTTMSYVENVSIDIYERSLKLAMISGCLALWTGYTNIAFLKGFVEAVFSCEITKNHKDPIPGLESKDYRFLVFLHKAHNAHKSNGEELKEIYDLANSVLSLRLENYVQIEKLQELSNSNRVMLKILGRLELAA